MTRKRLLVQAGHALPREPGFESGTGTIREIELASVIQKKLKDLLAADPRFEVTYCPGDIPDGWRGDVFLALHGDGSGSTSASGYCYGYPPDSLSSRNFTKLLAAEYERIPGGPPHRTDNYTGSLRGYYGWRRVHAPVKVLVEHGFLTNPGEREWMFSNARRIAEAHYRALCRHFGFDTPFPARPPKPVITPKPEVLVDLEVDGEGRNDGQKLSNPAFRKRLDGFLDRLAEGKIGRIVVTRSKDR